MKRIRVEMDVPDDTVDRLQQELGVVPKTFFGLPLHAVEVIEPAKYTELVLRTSAAVDARGWVGDDVHLYGLVDVPWQVLSCAEREEYPS